MDSRDRSRIVDRYNQRLARFGHDPRTLASGPPERHALRFAVLREAGIESGMSVLDVGCGFGDFYDWLRRQGLDVRYTGADINPALVEIAKQNHPDAAFLVADLQVDDLPARFDFVVSSSAFNLTLAAGDNYAFVADMLARAYAIADRGVAFDFLSSYVDFTGEDAFHYQPERVFEIAKRLTKRVTLRHDYPLYEFCVYLYPDFEGMGTTPVTPVRVCLTFDVDLVGHAMGDGAIDEFADAIPSMLFMFDRHPDWAATWFIRLDDQIAATLGDPAAIFERHAAVLADFRARGHEVGWHPHSYARTADGRWRQNTEEALVLDELSRLAPVAIGHGCRAVRCGWGFHTSRTMQALAGAGFAIDSSAIPRPRYRWETSRKDWTTTPATPYHPAASDYRVPGHPALPILEVPMSVAVVRSPTDTEIVLRYLNPSFHAPLFAPALALWMESHNHVITVTHPYEAVSSGKSDPLISFDLDTVEANIRLVEEQARAAQRPVTFLTLSQFAAESRT